MTGITIHKTRIFPALALFILAFFLFSFPLSGKSSARVLPPSGEDRLILYTSMQSDVVSSLVREFENRTGVWVSIKTGGSLSELSRVSSGEKADWDVILAPADVLERSSSLFAAAGDREPGLLSPARTVFPYALSNIVIIYNTKLVTLHPPDSWFSLLDPVWKGRTALFDPEDTGEGYSFLHAVSRTLSLSDQETVSPQDLSSLSGQETVSSQDVSSPPGQEAISAQDLSSLLRGHYFSDMDELIRAVADGTCYIGVVSEDAALRAVAAGYDITIVRPKENTSPVSNAMAVLRDSPRQENAWKFLSFLTDDTIQEYLEERFFFCPSPLENLPEEEAEP